MKRLALDPLETSGDNRILLRSFRTFPLLQFNENGRIPPIRILSSQDEIDSLRCLRNVIFNGYASILRNLAILQDPIHVLRIDPRSNLLLAEVFSTGAFSESPKNDISDVIGPEVAAKLAIRSRIHNHQQ